MKNSRRWLGWFAAAVVAVFVMHWDVLTLGFFLPIHDDLIWIERVSSFGFYDWIQLYSPHWINWYYRPATLAYWGILYAIFGADSFAWHAVGLLIHAANITLLGLLVYRVRRSVWGAVACAALALFWPGQRHEMGALDWVSAHSALLALFFYLGTLHLWLSYRASGSWKLFTLALLCFWMALTSKEDALSLPLALLCFDTCVCSHTSPLRARLRLYAPFAAVYICYLALDVAAYLHLMTIDGNIVGFLATPMTERITLIPDVCNVLLQEWLYLSPYEPVAVALACLLLLGFVLRKDKAALTFYLWSLVALVPMPLAIAYEALMPRFLYLPIMVTAVMVGVLASTGISYALILWRHYSKPKTTNRSRALAAVAEVPLALSRND